MNRSLEVGKRFETWPHKEEWLASMVNRKMAIRIIHDGVISVHPNNPKNRIYTILDQKYDTEVLGYA